ncbi:hypothetical protein Bca4012_063132 [Brassica carinata]
MTNEGDVEHQEEMEAPLKIGPARLVKGAILTLGQCVLNKMELPDLQIKRFQQPLMSFNVSSQKAVRTKRLSIYIGGVMVDAKLTINNSSDMYNIILGTPWIHAITRESKDSKWCQENNQTAWDGKPIDVKLLKFEAEF